MMNATTTRFTSSQSVLNEDHSNFSSVPQLRERSNTFSFETPHHQMDTKTEKTYTREMTNACKVIDKFLDPKLLHDQSIPKELLSEAHGLVFLTVLKAGFLLSGKVGKGFVIARTSNGWSAPSFLGSGGVGFGMMAGGEMVNYMVILSSRQAVKVFTRTGQFQMGSELDLAVGPIGRAASASVNIGRHGLAPNYSYSHSMGLYGGVGLASAVICTRNSLNAKCYGKNVSTRDILGGVVTCQLAKSVWEKLDTAMGIKQRRVRPQQFSSQKSLDRRGSSSGGEMRCEVCGQTNDTDVIKCRGCQSLLVFTAADHSGRRKAGKLVMTKQMSEVSV